MSQKKEKCKKDTIDIVKVKDRDFYNIDVDIFNKNNKTYIINNEKLEFENNKKYYKFQPKKSQCNNNIEQWQTWFTIPYYYLGNRNGRYNDVSINEITYSIPGGCFDKCDENFIINSDGKCENKKTFNGGKYRNLLPYDPFAIICIIVSKNNFTTTHLRDKEGNYYDTVEKLLNNTNSILKKNNMIVSDTTIRDTILKDIHAGNITVDTPLNQIQVQTNEAYKNIEEYAKYIVKDLEKDKDKIKNKITSDINKFYNLFDKRDELYMKYLTEFSTEKKKLNLLYAFTCSKIKLKLDDKEIQFLLDYCKFICFSTLSIFAERLDLYGIYSHEQKIIIGDYPEPTYAAVVAAETQPNTQSSSSDLNDLKPNYIKLENKNIVIFEDYSNILELYKSFLTVYPVIITIIFSLLIVLIILYLWDKTSEYAVSNAVNYIYSFILWFNYIFKWLIFNYMFIYIIRNILYVFYNPIISTYIKDFFVYLKNNIVEMEPITIAILFLIIAIIVIVLAFTITIEDFILFIPWLIIALFKLIGYLLIFLMGLIFFLFNIDNLILISFIIYILYLYYNVIYSFKFNNILTIIDDIDKNLYIPEDMDSVEGSELIVNLFNTDDAQKIIYNRMKLMNYYYLYNLYNNVHNEITNFEYNNVISPVQDLTTTNNPPPIPNP